MIKYSIPSGPVRKKKEQKPTDSFPVLEVNNNNVSYQN